MSAVLESPAKAKPQLGANRLKQTAYENNMWTVYPEKGTTVEDMLVPDYWAHVGLQLRPYDEIRVCSEDRSFYARLLVVSSDRLWAKTVVLESHALSSAASKEAAGIFDQFKVEHAGPHHKWRVVRIKDSEVLVKELGTKDEAEGWLKQYVKVIA